MVILPARVKNNDAKARELHILYFLQLSNASASHATFDVFQEQAG